MGDIFEFPSQNIPSFAQTDLGNAELLQRLYRRAIRWTTDRRVWYVWGGNRWVADGDGSATRSKACVAVREFISDDKWRSRSEVSGKIESMLKLAQCLDGMAVVSGRFDSDDRLLNLSNGVLNLESFQLLPHDPEYMLSKISDTAYVPDAQSDLWDRFLHRATGGDQEFMSYLARFAGYCLQGSVGEKCFFFVYGPGDTSKSTFLNAVGRTLGDYCVYTNVDTWLKHQNVGGNRGDLVRIMGCRLAISGEPWAGCKFDSSLIKQVTGGDPITFAAKYEGECTFHPKAKIVMAGNDSPSIQGGDEAMWRRMRRIPFYVQIPRDEQDPKLPDRLAEPDVRSAILSWAVNGLREWRRDGLGTCAPVEESTAEYKETEDEFMQFIRDNYVVTRNEHDRIGVTETRMAYDEWARKEGAQSLSSKRVTGRMKQIGASSVMSNGKRWYVGIRHNRGIGDGNEV